MIGFLAELKDIPGNSRHCYLRVENPQWQVLGHSFSVESKKRLATTDKMPSEMVFQIVGQDYIPECQGLWAMEKSLREDLPVIHHSLNHQKEPKEASQKLIAFATNVSKLYFYKAK